MFGQKLESEVAVGSESRLEKKKSEAKQFRIYQLSDQKKLEIPNLHMDATHVCYMLHSEHTQTEMYDMFS